MIRLDRVSLGQAGAAETQAVTGSVCDSRTETSCVRASSPDTARMFPCLAGRPWHVLCRVSLHHKAPLSQRTPRLPQLCHGESPNAVVIATDSCSHTVNPTALPQSLMFAHCIVLLGGFIVTNCVSQDGRPEVYTAGGSAPQSAVSPPRGWVRSSTTLPPETVKMSPRNRHRVTLRRLKTCCLPLQKRPHLRQVTH